MTNIADLLAPVYGGLVADVLGHGHTDYWMDGGRGSMKSSTVSILIVVLLVSRPMTNATVFRRYGNTLRSTVYEQMLWAIHALGLDAWFRASRAPLEITYLPTGQKVAFVGLDDPRKSKGTVFPVGYSAIQWFEECDEIDGWEVIQSTLRTFRRGGGDAFWTFYTYNPPKTLWSWVNRQALEMERKPDACRLHTTYLDVVEGGRGPWLGEQFIQDADYERAEHPLQYRWEFLGEVTGTGGSVFDNIAEVRLTDEDIRGFDNHRNGLDWGWFPDPWRFVRCEWQPGLRRLVLFAELSANRTIPEETAEMVRGALTWRDEGKGEPVYHRELVSCDSADQTSINVYRKRGINARAAEKGNMRRRSYEWLAGLREIAIDPERCPRAWEEFRLCEYAKDRAGEWVDDVPDGNDHSIDAVRYAMMRDIRRGR